MEFKEFKKIPRFSREIIVTEKIDGSNGQIFIYDSDDELRFPYIDESNIPSKAFIQEYSLAEKDGLYLFAGSRNRWLKCGGKNDNHAFAFWVVQNAEELFQLGPGRHYGEWYGKGIQRGYGLEEKRFSLFNVSKWVSMDVSDSYQSLKLNQQYCPKCCEVVPILYEGLIDTEVINTVLDNLRKGGSYAVPQFMNPEGIVIFHTASGQYFKKTIENDEKHKGEV
jgi:hypothetical protein